MAKSTINNQVYDDLAHSWWDESSPFFLLKSMVNPWRVPYFTDVIKDIFQEGLSSLHVLDIGCGGGLLTEEYSRLGCRVTGIDISPRSIEAARAHAQLENLSIDYQTGSASDIKYNEGYFEIVSCCDRCTDSTYGGRYAGRRLHELSHHPGRLRRRIDHDNLRGRFARAVRRALLFPRP